MQLKINVVENNAPEVLLYDVIGGMDVNTGEVLTAKSFIEQVRLLANSSLINIRINSAGGSVFDAVAIYNYLLDMSCEIHVYIDGLAASAASLIAMAGDKIFMPKNALIMIHNPSSFIDGNAEDLKNAAETLDKVRNGMLEIYMAKTGMERGELIKMLDAETWLDADEALKLGFCDEVIDAVQIQNCLIDKDRIKLLNDGCGAEVVGSMAKSLLEKTDFEVKKRDAQGTERKFKTAEDLTAAYPDLAGKIETQAVRVFLNRQKSWSVEDLKAAYPDLVKEIEAKAAGADVQGTEQNFNSGVEAERSRLKELDDLLKLVPECEAIINQAKYESFKHAGDIALEVLRNSKALKALKQDAQAIDEAVKPEIKARDDQAENLLIKNLNNLRGV